MFYVKILLSLPSGKISRVNFVKHSVLHRVKNYKYTIINPIQTGLFFASQDRVGGSGGPTPVTLQPLHSHLTRKGGISF